MLLAETTPIAMSNAPKPSWEKVEMQEVKGPKSLWIRVLGGELDTGKMLLNLCGLATGLFPKDKNFCLFLHQRVSRNSGKLGSPGLSPIMVKAPIRFFVSISASCFWSSQEQVTLAGV